MRPLSFFPILSVVMCCSLAPADEIGSLLDQLEHAPHAFIYRDPSLGQPGSNPYEELDEAAPARPNIAVPGKVMAGSEASFSAAGHEKLEDFFEGEILRDPQKIEAEGLNSARLSNETWSGAVWSMYRGHTALRYKLKPAAQAKSWEAALSFVSKKGNTFFDIATSSNQSLIDALSPAEKYDLLIAPPEQIPNGALTQYEWNEGRKKIQREGKVASWYGYCHGWAVASFLAPRPLNTVSVLAADGKTRINFNPTDLKALATVLFANAMPDSKSLGERCNLRKPPTDKNGRILDESCFDVNPGIFHLALVNQLGVRKQNLLIDATYDIQVWNQPIRSYKFHYFNPQTKAVGRRFVDAVIPMHDFKKDRFTKYRSPSAKKIVGVALEIEYGASVTAVSKPVDNAGFDRVQKATYAYDLEIDGRDEVIGGEWYQLKHPDFIWFPSVPRPVSDFEAGVVGEWNDSGNGNSNSIGQVPVAWREAALKSASHGQPLTNIVYRLLELSRANAR